MLERTRPDLVVLAGYLRLIPAPVVARYHGRMLNVHPALLPAFGGPGMYGSRVHEAVLANPDLNYNLFSNLGPQGTDVRIAPRGVAFAT